MSARSKAASWRERVPGVSPWCTINVSLSKKVTGSSCMKKVQYTHAGAWLPHVWIFQITSDKAADQLVVVKHTFKTLRIFWFSHLPLPTEDMTDMLKNHSRLLPRDRVSMNAVNWRMYSISAHRNNQYYTSYLKWGFFRALGHVVY